MAASGVALADELFARAYALHRQGQAQAAEPLYREVLARQPRHADALLCLGTICLQRGAVAEALGWLRQSLLANPRNLDVHVNLADALARAGDATGAEACLAQALRLSPDRPDLHFSRARLLRTLGRQTEARASLERALAQRPGFVEALNDLGILLWEARDLDAASDCFTRAIAVAPDLAAAHVNLGSVRLELGLRDEAMAHLDQAGVLDPNNANIPLSRGNALLSLGRADEAQAEFERAVALAPQSPEAHWNLALCLLRLGRYGDGWREHEWRFQTRQLAPAARRLARPLWLGETNLADRTLLIHAEQGLGDSLQFCRYAALAAQQGARVVLAVQKPLVELLKRLPGVAQVIGPGEPLPSYDVHCPMMSLPLAFGTTLANIPATVRYLSAPPAKVARWADAVASDTRLRVGLVWAGGVRPHQPESARVDALRSIPLAQFGALRLPGVVFHSLQKGEAAEAQLAELSRTAWTGPEIVAHGHDLDDFTDTAALVEHLDLVITVDTAVAHLAAAMGRPTWLLNRYNGCWRWLEQRDDSPWYPTLRLFRQPEPGDWTSVMGAVRQALLDRLASPHR